MESDIYKSVVRGFVKKFLFVVFGEIVEGFFWKCLRGFGKCLVGEIRFLFLFWFLFGGLGNILGMVFCFGFL